MWATLAKLGLMAAGIGGAVLLQGPLGEANAHRRRNDFRYTPDPSVTKIVAGAHRSTVADMIWLRALPDLAREFDDVELKKRWLNGVFEVVTDLEPTFLTVYYYGSAYLALLDSNADDAVALLERGIRRNPENTALLVELGMVHWKDRKDRESALEYLREAADRPDVDGLTLLMLSSIDVRGRQDLAALVPWIKGMERYEDRPRYKDANELQLERRKRQIVRRALKDYEAEHGRAATSLEELRGTELIEPQAQDLVLEGITLLPDGSLDHPRFDELNIAATKRAAKDWCHRFLNDYGRYPTLEDLIEKKQIGLPKLPDGKSWVLRKDELLIDPDDL